MDKEKFCEKLKRARLEAGLKQEHVAEHINMQTSTISIMETGRRKINVFELKKLADIYDKPVEWFFHEHNPHHKRRWYDLDPIISEAVDLLRKASTKLQKSTAYAIIGFLKQSGLVDPDREV